MDSVNIQVGEKERDITYPKDVSQEEMKVKIEAGSVSNVSVASQRSKSTTATQKRTKAEGARLRLEIAKQEVTLRKKMAALEEESRLAEAKKDRIKAEMNADLSLLAEEKEVVAAEVEATYLESPESVSGSVRSRGSNSVISDHFMPISTEERTRQYVSSLADSNVPNNDNTRNENRTHAHNPTFTVEKSVLSPEVPPFVSKDCAVKTDTEAFTSFLLKKDMILQRLYNYNNEPQSFEVWRASFSSVVQELKVNAFEQLDLLVKYLGKESSSYAQSLRASNARNPDRAVRLIWERLEERYGRPEMIEFSLKMKLEKFPVLSNKDNKKLYELSDLLDEILSAKEDPKFAVQFAMFDSSRGVNSIVSKLPFNIQQKWVTHASKYKKQRNIPYPPFSVFVEFMHDICRVRNDPAFDLEFVPNQRKEKYTHQRKNDKVFVVNRKTDVTEEQAETSKDMTGRCVIHNSGHPLSECRDFKSKTWEQRRVLLKSKGVCFKCLASTKHMSPKCPVEVECDKCGRKSHLTVMHRDKPTESHGGESKDESKVFVSTNRTAVFEKEFKGRSCGKTVLVDVTVSSQHTKKFRTYALLDDQSNRSLVTPELCNMLGVTGETIEYTLSSCSGRTTMIGQRIDGLSVQSVSTSTSHRYSLPELIECDNIPQDLSEVPTPDVAKNYSHLKEIAPLLHPLDSSCGIHLLIGRDLLEVHHVKHQIIGPKQQPFALELPLGWVIIGKVCLGKFHQPDVVHAYKTNVAIDGRGTVMDLCENIHTISKHKDEGLSICNDLFHKSHDDNKVGLSADDRQFVRIMDSELTKDSSGQWMAPLPFKEPREILPNNRAQAYQRARILDKSLLRNSVKRQHMVEFMDKVFKGGAAELAVDTDKEKWFLPLFGVYHPRKPDQIRGVFDSLVLYKGKSLNDMLLSGPNLTNSIVGVLLRFRGDAR